MQRTQTHVLLTPDERRIIKEAADRAGVSVSHYLRAAGLASARKALASDGEKEPT